MITSGEITMNIENYFSEVELLNEPREFDKSAFIKTLEMLIDATILEEESYEQHKVN